jgi:hypothetical protein
MEPSRISWSQHQVCDEFHAAIVPSLSAPRMTILSVHPVKDAAALVTKNNVAADSECEEVADLCRDLLRMGLEREVARFEEMDHGTGYIAPERLGTARQEKGIVLSPDG